MTPQVIIPVIIILIASVLIYLNKDKWKRKDRRYKLEFIDGLGNVIEKEFYILLHNYNGFYLWDKYATELARHHSIDMMNDNSVSHQLYFERQKALLDKGAKRVAEIVGTNISEEGMFTAFLNSPDHRKVIDDPNYNAVGIGITQQGTKLFFTVLFFEV